ncbi:debranching enzyme 1 [Carex rostrata]
MALISLSKAYLISKSGISTRNTQFRSYGQNNFPKFQLCLLRQRTQNIHKNTVSLASKSGVPQLVPNQKTVPPMNEVEYVSRPHFLTENGGVVNVLIFEHNEDYIVRIDVSKLPKGVKGDGLFLDWGMYRSDSSQLSGPDGTGTVKVPLMKNSLREPSTELQFNYSQAPFYLSFVVLDSAGSAIKSHRGTRFCLPFGIESGKPMPLGFSFSDDGKANFSLFSRNAESVILCLFEKGNEEPGLEIELDPYLNRSGDIWHISLDAVDKYSKYGYRCKGPLDWKKGGRFHMRHVLLDPYSKIIENFASDKGEKVSFAKCLASLATEKKSFDWGGIKNPNLPMEKLVVYRLNVGLTAKDKSFSGLIEKIPHFKQLSVNAILLEPIFSFDERKGPYYPYHFFSPMKKIGSIDSLKEMVKVMHKNGIEVFLEVSLSGTSEGDDISPQTISFRGIDNSSYYMNGGSSILNCNKTVVQTLILDCLRYWVVEFHIDGFSFVNSSLLLKSSNGIDILSRPAFVESIAFDPILAKTKFVSDSFSPVELSTQDLQFPHWKRWSEMNSKFYTDVRNFLQGEGLLSNFATRLCGSGDKFSSRGPAFSFNYITRNFGLTLVDLVSFNNASEMSWNCGEDGATENAAVLETRLRQIRNFLFILFISIGVPVLNMGDECGYSTGGSIAYNDRKQMNWSSMKTPYGKQITQFIAYLAALRSRKDDIFQRKEFLKLENIIWGGSDGVHSEPNWLDPACKFLSVLIKPEISDLELTLARNGGEVFICFNAGDYTEKVLLPEGSAWVRLVDTALPFPGFFVNEGDSVVQVAGLSSYEILPHSCVLFEAKGSTE